MLSQKRKELNGYEKDLSVLLQKIETANQQAKEIFSPILKEKAELERLDKKITDRLAGMDAAIQGQIEQSLMKEIYKLTQTRTEFQQKTDTFLKDIRINIGKEFDKRDDIEKAFQVKIENAVEANRQQMDSKIADFLYKQNALVTNLSQQIDSYQRLTESLRSALESLTRQISNLENENSQLHQFLQTTRQELAQHKDNVSTTFNELCVKIQNLEKERTFMQSDVSELTEKIKNMKFKKILGL